MADSRTHRCNQEVVKSPAQLFVEGRRDGDEGGMGRDGNGWER